MDYITIALAKGRLADLSIDFMSKIGICFDGLNLSRKLIFDVRGSKTRFILAKTSDVPVFVEYGAADLGIVGKDTLLESERDVYEMLDLKFGACKVVVAGPPDFKNGLFGVKRVATKYPNLARDFFKKKGMQVEIIKLTGSVEIAPLVGLSDIIVDIVETGRTLRENGLIILEDICDASARLIVNRASLKMKSERMREIIQKCKEVINGGI